MTETVPLCCTFLKRRQANNPCFGPPRTSHRSGCRTGRPGCARAHAFEQVAFAGVTRRRAGAKQHSGSFTSTDLLLTSRHYTEGGLKVIIRTLQQVSKTIKVLCEEVIRALGCYLRRRGRRSRYVPTLSSAS